MNLPQPSADREDLMARTLSAEFTRLFRQLTFDTQAGPNAVLMRIRALMNSREINTVRLRRRLEIQLDKETTRVVNDLLHSNRKLGAEMTRTLGDFSSRQAFGERIEQLRALYLNDSVDRMEGEEDDLKAAFLEKLNGWAEGGEELDVKELVSQMKVTSARRARFFARDQFSRFNRSVMVASYQQAEAEYVEWLTSNDNRVRDAHRERNHKIFTMEQLLADPEWKSYNCRCGFAPLWTLTESQKARRVA